MSACLPVDFKIEVLGHTNLCWSIHTCACTLGAYIPVLVLWEHTYLCLYSGSIHTCACTLVSTLRLNFECILGMKITKVYFVYVNWMCTQQ